MAKMNRRPERGFTLIEVLVAMAMFAATAAIAYSGFDQFNRQRQLAEDGLSRLREIQFAVRTLTQDFLQLQPRPVRDPMGDTVLPALVADPRREHLLEYTRAGWSNPLGLPRGTLQRVAYRLEDDELIREHWTVLDRTLANEAITQTLLDRVQNLEIRYIDRGRNPHSQWPPAEMDPVSGRRARPIAVEIMLELEDWGQITRLIEVTG